MKSNIVPVGSSSVFWNFKISNGLAHHRRKAEWGTSMGDGARKRWSMGKGWWKIGDGGWGIGGTGKDKDKSMIIVCTIPLSHRLALEVLDVSKVIDCLPHREGGGETPLNEVKWVFSESQMMIGGVDGDSKVLLKALCRSWNPWGTIFGNLWQRKTACRCENASDSNFWGK